MYYNHQCESPPIRDKHGNQVIAWYVPERWGATAASAGDLEVLVGS